MSLNKQNIIHKLLEQKFKTYKTFGKIDYNTFVVDVDVIKGKIPAGTPYVFAVFVNGVKEKSKDFWEKSKDFWEKSKDFWEKSKDFWEKNHKQRMKKYEQTISKT